MVIEAVDLVAPAVAAETETSNGVSSRKITPLRSVVLEGRVRTASLRSGWTLTVLSSGVPARVGL